MIAMVDEGNVGKVQACARSANSRGRVVEELGPRVEYGRDEHVARNTAQGIQLNVCSQKF